MNLLNLQIKVVNTNNDDLSLCDRYYDHGHFHEGDSGIDLFCPDRVIVEAGETKFIDLKIQCQMLKHMHPDNFEIPVSYYLYPRSSICRTPLRLANSVGIIDAGYRGNIIACVDNIKNEEYIIEAGTRLFQICSSDLSPIRFEIVNSLPGTTRGIGGFGSTNEPEVDNYIHSSGHYHGRETNILSNNTTNNMESQLSQVQLQEGGHGHGHGHSRRGGHDHGHGHGPDGECL